MGRSFGFLGLVLLAGIVLPSFAIAAPIDTQQNIIAQKEQKQASKRAEQELQHRVSQSMAKSQQQGSRLEAFVLPKERLSSFVDDRGKTYLVVDNRQKQALKYAA